MRSVEMTQSGPHKMQENRPQKCQKENPRVWTRVFADERETKAYTPLYKGLQALVQGGRMLKML